MSYVQVGLYFAVNVGGFIRRERRRTSVCRRTTITEKPARNTSRPTKIARAML